MYVYMGCSRVVARTGRRRIVDCVVRVAVETSVRGSAKEAGGMGAQGTDQLDRLTGFRTPRGMGG